MYTIGRIRTETELEATSFELVSEEAIWSESSQEEAKKEIAELDRLGSLDDNDL